jgi:hypothetical protein
VYKITETLRNKSGKKLTGSRGLIKYIRIERERERERESKYKRGIYLG